MRIFKTPFYNAQKEELVCVHGAAWLYGFICLFVTIVIGFILIYLSAFLPISASDMDSAIRTASSFGGAFVASSFVLYRFHKKHGRVMARKEYKIVTKLGAVANIIFTLPIVFLVMLDMKTTVNEFAFITAFILVVGFLLMWFLSCIVFRMAISAKAADIKRKQKVAVN